MRLFSRRQVKVPGLRPMSLRMSRAQPCVSIVDDDDLVRTYFEHVLVEGGYTCRPFSRCSDALADLTHSPDPPDLILSDIRMEGMTGLEFLREIRNTDRSTPVILISGHYDLPDAMDAIGNGAADYLLKPALPEDILAAVAKHVIHYAVAADASVTAAPALSSEAAFSIDLCNLTSRTAGKQLMELARSMAEKRAETLEHSRRVASYAVATGRRFCGVNLKELQLAAMLHDVGKVGVPENVVNKPGPLNGDEWRIMKLHPAIGRDLVKLIPCMDGVAEIVYSHHERFNGTGYPRGLAANDIPLCARIFSVVDTFDAMTSDRPYRPAQTPAAARAELERMSGEQFDPAVVEEFLKIPEAEIELIRQLHSESSSRR